MKRFLRMCQVLKNSQQLNYDTVNAYLSVDQLGTPMEIGVERASHNITQEFRRRCLFWVTHGKFKVPTIKTERIFLKEESLGVLPTLVHTTDPNEPYIFFN